MFGTLSDTFEQSLNITYYFLIVKHFINVQNKLRNLHNFTTLILKYFFTDHTLLKIAFIFFYYIRNLNF